MAIDLVVSCYAISAAFPRSEVYGLSSQMRRASVSVPANIAEGYGRQHRPEYLNHLSIASGSLTELETHIQIAARLSYIDEGAHKALMLQADEVGRMLGSLRRSLSHTS